MDIGAKLRPLYLLRILKERTAEGEDNYLTVSRLCNILKQSYGMETHRTTINGDIEVLRKAGFSVDERRPTQNQYRYIDRDFEIA